MVTVVCVGRGIRSVSSPRWLHDAVVFEPMIGILLSNEKKVIDILGRRTQLQRESIAEAYKILFEESLPKRLKACCSGKLEKCLLLWMMDPSERDAVLLYEALREGGPKKDRAVIGMLCTRTPGQMYLIKQAYYTLFNQTLENHLDGSGFVFIESQNKVLLSSLTNFSLRSVTKSDLQNFFC